MVMPPFNRKEQHTCSRREKMKPEMEFSMIFNMNLEAAESKVVFYLEENQRNRVLPRNLGIPG